MATTTAAQKMNCLWPLTRGGKGWIRGSMAARYEAAIKNLLRTPLGHYPWAPTYGTTIYLHRTQSEPYVEGNTAMEAELSLAFKQWLPDVTLLGTKAQMEPSLQRWKLTVGWGIPAQRGGRVTYIVGPVQTTVLI